jgi:ABC-type lipoprotein export system ATPase subunit
MPLDAARCRSMSAIPTFLTLAAQPRDAVYCWPDMACDPLVVRNLYAQGSPRSGEGDVVQNFSYDFQAGVCYRLTGSHGAEKSLLLQLLGLQTMPDCGEIQVDGIPVNNMNLDDLSDLRNRKFGFLFAGPFLLPAFTVLENVAMPLFKIAQVAAPEAKIITEEIMNLVGVTQIADRSIGELSALEQVQTALARALVHHPRIFIAENLGSKLSPDATERLLGTIRQAARRLGMTAIFTTGPLVGQHPADVCI